MVPTRAQKATLGTNPISLAAPALDKDDSFLLDMATTTVAVGKIELSRRKGLPIPKGWATDKDGKVTTDPNAYAALMPLGGVEEHGGYKGYGSDYGPNIRQWMSHTKVANLGQCFIAVDPDCFAEGFQSRMSDLMDCCRKLEPVSHTHDCLGECCSLGNSRQTCVNGWGSRKRAS